MFKRLLFPALAGFALLASPAALQARQTQDSADPTAMTGAELRALLSQELTLRLGGDGTEPAGRLTLRPDGTAVGRAIMIDGRPFDLSGTWAVEGDRFCRQWRYDEPKRLCETWRRIDERRVEVLVEGKRIGERSW